MREIKFRAWDEKNGYEYWDSLACPSYSVPELFCSGRTLEQFTGLHDKNNKEIYEGDQLHICAGYSSVVEFQDAMFVSVYSHPEDGETLPIEEVDTSKFTIIGSKHVTV